ncbi:hypothetical protein [Bradyrhizobium elkanii]|uniref:Uncharacterized protein n=1 Tax=Bradyrhizobium elkanii TaxID=29448 RepID=A0ABV4F077_BRAEL|nr:hypothetical protein [Bradyrhizobium elkanii]MCP1757848.1 hypothetical protein [Bradyrhizobium elkanii]MCS3881855.1 hypothetical protein [Bradyrhizobium elkanii]MCS4218614.1 hypothetical protein [Bradyrhizobium elkanii]MCW2110086.1 hypothetical protein [Bradyrhizobium elkanii]MCW2201542.1 hypothetical protein [Bradyrhizobium elkanii]
MPKYTADVAFWHKGNLVPVGGTVSMTKVEAKYLKGKVTEVVWTAPATPAPAVEEPKAETPALGAAVVEHPNPRPHKKRKAEVKDGDNGDVN